MKKYFCLFLSFFAMACSSLQEKYLAEPKVTVERVDVQNASLTGATLLFVLNIHNPNKIDIDVEKVSYKVFLDQKLLANSATEKPVKVKAQDDSHITLPLPVNFDKLFDSLKGLLSNKTLPYKVEGVAKISVFTIPFKSEGKVEL